MTGRIATSRGEWLLLGAELGRGGEGAVHAIEGDPSRVAKLYAEPVTGARAAKLRAMIVEPPPPTLRRIAAWPIDVVPGNDGAIAGFVMPRVTDAHEAHNAYNSQARLRLFPEAGWGFLVRAARNVARALAIVHDAGHVVGDLNQRGVMIAADASATLIDCDSFQVTRRGEVHRCLVGVPEFTPPELMGVDFSRVTRTPQHDAFGLAVLLFHFLFLGRHPYAGRFRGPGDMPLEQAIRESRFAYGANASLRGMKPPPGALPYVALPGEIAEAFGRAFAEPRAAAPRPSAHDWQRLLAALESSLATCSVDTAHAYPRHAGACPWCDLERAGGSSLFVPRLAHAAVERPAVDVDAIDALLKSFRVPAVPPAEPVRSGAASTTSPAARGGKDRTPLGSLLHVLLGFPMRWRNRLLERAARAQHEQAEQVRRDAYALRHEAFEALCRSARNLVAEHRGLPRRRARELAMMKRRHRELQRLAFLQGFSIEDAEIPELPRGLVAVLRAEGYETAADVTPRVTRVRGVGPARRASLLAWRRSCEARFRFDAKVPLDDRLVDELEKRLRTRRDEIERQLATMPDALRRAHDAVRELLRE